MPDVGSWNFAFSGVKWSVGMKYGLRLANPKAFFDEAHRAHHFLEFNAMEEGAVEADVPDHFS